MQRVTNIPKRILWPSGLGTTLAVQQAVASQLMQPTQFPFTGVVCKLPRGAAVTSNLVATVNVLREHSWYDVIAALGMWYPAWPNAEPTRPRNRYLRAWFYEQALVDALVLKRLLGATHSMIDLEIPTTITFPETAEGQREKLAWLQKHGPTREELWTLLRPYRWWVRHQCQKAARSRYGRPVDWIHPAHGTNGYGRMFHPLAEGGLKWEDRTYKWRGDDALVNYDNPEVWCSWVTTTPENHNGVVKPLVPDELFALELPDTVTTLGIYVSKNDVESVLGALAKMGE
jgi:hypothetical protein